MGMSKAKDGSEKTILGGSVEFPDETNFLSDTKFEGDLNVEGNLNVSGKATITGDMIVEGSLEVQGTLKIKVGGQTFTISGSKLGNALTAADTVLTVS
tara:strand:- start:202 stop:495 length:294 start_codon:yes stop_codon:yes gene_type:complete